MKLSQLHEDSPPDYLLEYAGVTGHMGGFNRPGLQTTGTGSEAARGGGGATDPGKSAEIAFNPLGGMWVGTPKASAGTARAFSGGVSGDIPGGEEEKEEGAKERVKRKGDIRASQGSEAPEDKPPMSWEDPTTGPATQGTTLKRDGGRKRQSKPWTPTV